MKKLVLSMIAIAMIAVSCGPSSQEIEAKRVADSTKVADSIALVKQQVVADSITKAKLEAAKADSIAKLAKPVKHVKHIKK